MPSRNDPKDRSGTNNNASHRHVNLLGLNSIPEQKQDRRTYQDQ